MKSIEYFPYYPTSTDVLPNLHSLYSLSYLWPFFWKYSEKRMSVFIYLLCFHLPVQRTNNHKLYFLCENLNDRSISKASSTWDDQMLSACLGGIMHLLTGRANQEQLPNVDLCCHYLHWDIFLGCFSSTLVLSLFPDRENEVGKFLPKAATRNVEQHKAVCKEVSFGRCYQTNDLQTC